MPGFYLLLHVFREASFYCRVAVRLSPRPDNGHAEGPKEHEKAGTHSLSSTKDAPALIAEEVLGHELYEGREYQKPGGNGIHDTNH